jgi:hypothetical protein
MANNQKRENEALEKDKDRKIKTDLKQIFLLLKGAVASTDVATKTLAIAMCLAMEDVVRTLFLTSQVGVCSDLAAELVQKMGHWRRRLQASAIKAQTARVVRLKSTKTDKALIVEAVNKLVELKEQYSTQNEIDTLELLQQLDNWRCTPETAERLCELSGGSITVKQCFCVYCELAVTSKQKRIKFQLEDKLLYVHRKCYEAELKTTK